MMRAKTLENRSNKELIIGLQQDDVEAFNAIYWRHQMRLLSNIFSLLKDINSAQDVLQDVFITLWEKRSTIDPDREVSGWLFTVSYHKSINHMKKSLKESLLFDEFNDELQASIHHAMASDEDRFAIIEKAVSQLSPQKRKVFDLCKFQGKTYDETAKELNISKHTVKEYLSSAVINVKEYVKLNAQANTTFLYLLFLHQFYH